MESTINKYKILINTYIKWNSHNPATPPKNRYYLILTNPDVLWLNIRTTNVLVKNVKEHENKWQIKQRAKWKESDRTRKKYILKNK